MNLNNIELNGALIGALYEKNWFIIADNNRVSSPFSDSINVTPENISIKYLGNNKKGITIVVNYKNEVYLPDDTLQFLINILQACKLTLDDVAIINEASQTLNWEQLQTLEKFQYLLLFGIESVKFGLNKDADFIICSDNNIQWLSSPVLETLNNTSEEARLLKSKLWMNLKQLFS